MTISQKISDFVLNLKYEDIPSETVEYVKLLIIDTLGCVTAAGNEEHVQIVKKTVEEMPNLHESTLWGTDIKVSADNAMIYNGSLIHGIDYDDTHGGAIIHPSSVVLNAGIALAEKYNKNGKELITAMVAAYEVMLRLGDACKGAMHRSFFHPTGIFAPFAEICVECSLNNIDKDVMVNALGLAGNFAASTMQFSVDGTWSKKLHPGWGAHAGMFALRFAKNGYVSSQEIFEGSQGLFMSHIGSVEHLENAFSDLKKRWYTNEIAFKFYPVCHMMHSHINLLLHYMEKENLIYEDIESIKAILYPRAADIVALPVDKKRNPESTFYMRFSIQYCLAAAAVFSQLSMREFNMNLIEDPRIKSMVDKVNVEVDPTSENPGYFPGTIEITLKNGKTERLEQKYEVGCPENPAKAEDVLRKFYANISPKYNKLEADSLIEQISNIEHCENICDLVKLVKT